jgi:hypothetical protein
MDYDMHLEPDSLMPSQFYDHWGGSNQTPEKRLALAVLELAIRDLRQPGAARRRQRSHSEAVYWLMNPSEGPFSFDGVCEMLEIEPTSLRARLREWDGQLARRTAVNGNGQKRIGEIRRRNRECDRGRVR